MSDMKTLSMRDLNRKTAVVLDALQQGESFEVRRNGKAVGYLTPVLPTQKPKTGWKAHFDWLQKQKRKGGNFVEELEKERRDRRTREAALDNIA